MGGRRRDGEPGPGAARGERPGRRPVHLRGRLRISRRNGDNWTMACAILGLACLAGDAGDWDRAAALHGAAQALQDRTGIPWQELDARTAGTAWTKRVRTWAMSSWSGPTPRAWRSASRRPSTWLSQKRSRPDRYRRETRGSSLTGQPGPPQIPCSRSHRTPAGHAAGPGSACHAQRRRPSSRLRKNGAEQRRQEFPRLPGMDSACRAPAGTRHASRRRGLGTRPPPPPAGGSPRPAAAPAPSPDPAARHHHAGRPAAPTGSAQAPPILWVSCGRTCVVITPAARQPGN